MTYSEMMIDALQNEKIEEAYQFFEQALLSDDNDQLQELALVLFDIGFLEETKEIATQLLDKNNSNDGMRLLLAEIAIEEGDDNKALLYLEELTRGSDYYVQSLLVEADYYQVHGLPEVSEQKLIEAREIIGDHPIVMFALGELYYSMRRYEEAMRLYEQLLQQGRDTLANVDLFARLANSYSAVGQFDDAVEYYKKSLDKAENIDRYFELAMTYYQQEEYEKAIENYELVLETDPAYTSIYPYLGDSYEKLEEYETALDTLLIGVTYDKTNSTLYYKTAEIYNILGDYEKAVSYYEEANELEPMNLSHRLAYIQVLFNKGEYKKILKVIAEAERLDSFDSRFYWAQALAYNEIEEYVKAGENFEKAYAYFDDRIDFLKDYIYFLREDGQWKKLNEVIDKYLQLNPEDLDILQMREDLP